MSKLRMGHAAMSGIMWALCRCIDTRMIALCGCMITRSNDIVFAVYLL
jgi:hypothetical protein